MYGRGCWGRGSSPANPVPALGEDREHRMGRTQTSGFGQRNHRGRRRRRAGVKLCRFFPGENLGRRVGGKGWEAALEGDEGGV